MAADGMNRWSGTCTSRDRLVGNSCFWPTRPEASALGQGLRRIEPRRGAGRNQRAEQRREQRHADAERDVLGSEAEERGRLEGKVRQAGPGKPVEEGGRSSRQEDTR